MNPRSPFDPVCHVVLVAPQIPNNTGAIVRLCANIGASLHLVEPLGFRLDSASLRRGGLDYGELTHTSIHATWDECREQLDSELGESSRWWALSTRAGERYDHIDTDGVDVFVFGCESDGLPAGVLAELAPRHLRIPMMPGSRSINLANAVAIVAVDSWRRRGFPGAGNDTATTAESFAAASRPRYADGGTAG